MKLFKYTKIERVPSCIEKGVYASTLDKINDPYEGKGIEYPESYRVVCLTSSQTQMLMWAYYGDHKGCCVEFEIPDNVEIRKVDYVKEFQSHDEMDTSEVIESLYKKGNEWAHEKEQRIVYYEDDADQTIWTIEKTSKGINVFLKAEVKSVLFGYAADADENYLRILKYLQKYNKTHSTEILVSRCKLKKDKYELEWNRQFNLDAEIRKITRESIPPTPKNPTTDAEELTEKGKAFVNELLKKEEIQTAQKQYGIIQEEAKDILSIYGKTLTGTLVKKNECISACKALRQLNKRVNAFIDENEQDIQGIPTKKDLKEASEKIEAIVNRLEKAPGDNLTQRDNTIARNAIRQLMKL